MRRRIEWWKNPKSFIWKIVRVKARTLRSDGCSLVFNFYLDACLYHDIMYRTHMDINGKTPVTRATADRRFREVIQSRSKFRRASPMAWWRWAGVRLFGRRAWRHE